MSQQDYASGREAAAVSAGTETIRSGADEARRDVTPPSRGMTLLFAVACGLAVANITYAQPLLDTIADDFGISHAAVGLVITVTQIGYGLGLLLVVPLGDILDRRALIVGQSLLLAVALVAVALAPSAAALLGAMAAVGGLAVVTQVMVAYAASLAKPGERGRAVGVVTSGVITGILLARTVAGTLSDLFGWRSVYLVSAGATLIVAALLFRALPRHSPPRARVSYGRLILSVFLLFVEEPMLRIRAVLALFIFFAITVLLTPLVLPLSVPPFQFSHTQIGLFGLAGAAGALGAANAGRWCDRGAAQRTTAIALSLMLASWALVALLPYSLWGLVVGIVVIDFGLQAAHVANQSLIYRVRPEAQSRLTAGYMIFYSIGCAGGSITSTLTYAAAGWGGVCALGATISAFALLFWALTRRLTWPKHPKLGG